MSAWLLALLSVALISAVSLVGIATLAINQERLRGALLVLVSFSVGALFGDAFIHLIPEAFDELGPGLPLSAYLIAGILVFFVLEKFVRWRHCHIPTSENHPHPVATMNLVGDGVHNLIDGMVVAGSYLASIPLGIATTVAVVLHEIPQEIGDYGILIHAGVARRKAVLYNFASALAAIGGAALVLALGSRLEGLAAALIPFTAGGFIYIAGTDLIPELQRDTGPARSATQLAAIIVGVTVMAVLLWME
jgi:zinc and cadmium transporter